MKQSTILTQARWFRAYMLIALAFIAPITFVVASHAHLDHVKMPCCMMLASAIGGVRPKAIHAGCESSEANAWSLFAVHRCLRHTGSTCVVWGQDVTVRKLECAKESLKKLDMEIAVDSRVTSIDTAKRLAY